MHPMTGPDHLLAMVAVGLWGAFLGRPLIFLLPVLFPMLMVVGAVLGMFNIPFPTIEPGIALSVIALGGCIACAVKAPAWVAMPIVAIFALFHGYAHGRELPSAVDPAGYALGFVLMTGLLHVAGIVLGSVKDRRGGERFVRAIGGLITLAGVAFLARWVAA